MLDIIAIPIAFARWTEPVRISNSSAYRPELDYANGVLHAMYCEWQDSLTYNIRRIFYHRSSDLGQTWSTPCLVSGDWGNYPLIKAAGDSVVAVWLCDGWRNYMIVKSTDGGLTWGDTSRIFPAPIYAGSSHDITLAGRNIYMVYTVGLGILFTRSTDWGVTWSSPGTLMTFFNMDGMTLRNIGDTLFLVVSGELQIDGFWKVYFLKSTDGGQNWSAPEIISLPDSAVSGFSSLEVNEAGELGVFWNVSRTEEEADLIHRVSHDFGQTWDPIDTVGYQIWGDAMDQVRRGESIQLVWSDNVRVFHTVSTNGGMDWSPADTIDSNDNLSYAPAIALSPDMAHVVWVEISEPSPGIYYSRWARENGIDDTPLPDKAMLFSAYPNPFNAQTTISYSLPEPGHVTLSIYNLLGQKVATLVDEVKQAGEHAAIWDSGDIPSGVYFVRLTKDNTVQVIKMTLIK